MVDHGVTRASGQSGQAQPIVLHPLIIRITHWLNALAIFIMIGSGWRIYNWEPLFSFEGPGVDDVWRLA